MTIQWFPGHMAKTRRLMQENLKLVDVVVEIVDARLPLSSRNPLINEIVGSKPRVLLLAKADLAEEGATKAWLGSFKEQGIKALACDFKSRNPKSEIKKINNAIKEQAGDILQRRQKRGINNQVIRVMITGIPNVGKSTMINLFSGKARAETGDRPGVTKGKQWIRLDKDLELLDMPGILWPNLEDKEGARKLAATGAIGDNAYSHLDLTLWLINWLMINRPGRLNKRYAIAEESLENDTADMAALAVLESIGRKRGLLRKGGVVERDKTAIIILDELRGGKLGPISLELPGDFTEDAEDPIDSEEAER